MVGPLVPLPAAAVALAYLAAAVCFILGLRGLTHPRTAVRGNLVSAVGMLIAVVVTLLVFEIVSPWPLLGGVLIGAAIGAWLATTVELTQLPQLVGLFNGFGGGASVLVAGGELLGQASSPLPAEVSGAAALAGLVGSVTFWGSLVAAGKLQGILEAPRRLPGELPVKAALLVVASLASVGLVLGPEATGVGRTPTYWGLVGLAALLGVLLVAPIGGADMPVVISLLNACSGLAAATTGFVLDNSVLIIAGTLVGASGLILTVVMCASMNRSLWAVLRGGFGDVPTGTAGTDYEGMVKRTSPEEVGVLLEAAGRVVIVPGYGLAVGQAQHVVADLADRLAAAGVEVEFGIHPVAGRMPGHMNVLLAEADVPYERLRDLGEINPTFPRTDVVIVTGANDVVNPAANTDPSSPIAGMPVLEVWEADTVIVNKRSLSPGYAGIPNPLFTRPNTYLLFGDARESMQAVLDEYDRSR